ncbi:MAG: PEP/pyruvate-binding domain-containing protein, partial [Planctomycetota bacterium]
MSLILELHQIEENDRMRVGGKAFHLALMRKGGMRVPRALCISGDAYREFVHQTGLNSRIHFELNRKNFEEMRWEEIWDGALRIRNLFINTPIPDALYQALEKPLQEAFEKTPVAVRSSGEDEDSAGRSFAGLHDSYVNVRGVESIVNHVKRVWASLWSDRALLYRKELGLDMQTSAMPVVVQELCAGRVSGVAFSRGPSGEDHAVIEAVYGLNQGLVDGMVQPDRWIVSRTATASMEHHPPAVRQSLVPARDSMKLIELPANMAEKPPLEDSDVLLVRDLVLSAETLFESPQDVEWTF